MSICLSMIIKNESEVIERCLRSVIPVIDYWVIVDTGSTDNSEEIVKKTLKDIPGKYLHEPWVNFAHNRNIALEEAKEHGDYVLIIDADDMLIISNTEGFKTLQSDIYGMQINYGNIIYNRPQLIKSTIPSYWKSPVHEYLECEGSRELFEHAYILISNEGARSKDPDKYINDAKLLETELINDPENPRYLYYCAQSYRDAGMLDKSIEMFERRSKVQGWSEEDYMALLNLGKLYLLPSSRIGKSCKNSMKDPIKAEEKFIQAYNKVQRAEAMYYLALHYRSINDFEKAYFYANIGLSCKKNTTALFMEHDIYDWKLLDEKAISSWYVGKKKESEELNKTLMRIAPEFHKARILNNLIISIR